MTLRVKLLWCFFVVLLLTSFVGFWGWRGMNELSRADAQGDAVNMGVVALFQAQSEQAKYFQMGNEEFADASEKSLEQSLANFRRNLTFLNPGDPLEGDTKKIIANVEKLLTDSKQLKDVTRVLVKVDDDYTIQGRTILATLNEVVSSAEAAQELSLSHVTTQKLKAMTDVRAKLYEVRYSTWLVSTNPVQKNLDIVNDGLAVLLSMLDKALPLMTAEKDRATLQRFRNEMAKYAAFADESGKLTKQKQDLVLASGALSASTLELAAKVSNTVDQRARAVQQSMAWQLLSVVGLAIALGLALALWVTNNVLHQLGRDPGKLATMARRVTDGDYAIEDGGIMRGVYADFVHMVGALRENMQMSQQEAERARMATDQAQQAAQEAEEAKLEAQNARRVGMMAAATRLDGVVEIVSAASAELSAQIEQSERGAAQQAARVTETATAMEEMNATVLEVAQNATTASSVSAQTRQQALAGAQVVEKSVNAIQTVQNQSLQLRQDMSQLDENTRAISHIMGVISDIADQTNLLALNAAIEAARAGDAGRGFAVVADEVRNLAEKTMASTTDVSNAIQGIQQAVARSVAQVDSSVKAIDEATEYVQQSGVALKEIVSMVDSTADQVRAIATAAEEQSASSEEINMSIGQVNVIANETARAMQESASAVSELAEQAHVLQNLIDDMKQDK